MGYYSFYKIIKDIFRTLFGSRAFRILLIILIGLILLINLSPNSLGASTIYIQVTDFSNNNTVDVALPSAISDNDLNYVIFLSKNSYSYGLYASNDTIYVTNNRLASSGSLKYAWTGAYNDFSTMTSYITTRVDQVSTYQLPLGDYTTTPENYYYFSNTTIKDANNNVIFDDNTVKIPEIVNSLEDLQSLNFDVISVNAWNWSNKEFDVLFYDRNVKDTSTTEGLYPKRVITLNKDTSYFQSDLSADPDKNAIYWIPIDEIGLNLYVGGSYEIRLAERVPLNPPEFGATFYYNYLGTPVNFTISSDVSQDKINAINKEIEDMTNKMYHDETMNKMDNINNNINNVNDALTNTTPDSSVSSDIDNSLDFDNQNEGLNNLNGGFFTRLTTMLSNLLGYNLADDTSVSIPLPNSNKSIVLHSNIIYNNVTGALRLIINAFWVYIFSFYMWKFINKIYIAVSTGNILDTFSTSGEAITNDML